jgi:hypothetical protein
MSAVGYVLVSQTYHVRPNACPSCPSGPKSRFIDRCEPPERPGCHARCVRDPRELAEHPECQEWQRQYDAWYEAHYHEEPTGGTRLGPLHYFSDCRTLTHRGPRRADARIVSLDFETATALGLPLCKECKAKMAPFEQEFATVPQADEKVGS